MIMGFILELGLLKAVFSFITMQQQLCSVFTFSLGTKTHYFGRTILHGGAKYRATGRGFVVRHIKFAENYRLYSRSHFVKAMEVALLLIVYNAYGYSRGGGGWKVVAGFEGNFPSRIKQLPLDRHFDIDNVKRVIAIATTALEGFKSEAKNMVVALVDMEQAFVPPQHFIRLLQRRLCVWPVRCGSRILLWRVIVRLLSIICSLLLPIFLPQV